MKPIVLCILDGVGIRKENHGNAVIEAKMPNFDFLWNTYPHSLLEASGSKVGLPDGQMGNSEVGHMNIGAGRIMYQPLELINQKIKDTSFFTNEELLKTIQHVKENHSKLHVFGLLSDGGIHSHISHLFALLDLCEKENVEKLYLHLVLDGRDTLPNIAMQYIKILQDKIKRNPHFKIATIAGRFYAMDRDNRWDRIQKAYTVMTKGTHLIGDIEPYIEQSYQEGITDEFIVPATIDPSGIIESNDGFIVFNYRPDRLRELLKALSNPKFSEFEALPLHNLKVTTMMNVSDEVKSTPAFHLPSAQNLLGQVLASHHLKQLRIAETEKYAHVTYFFDGGKELTLEGADRILIPSPKVATYDLSPDMSAIGITDTLLEKIKEDIYDVVILNYANGDMLGHTGKMKETIQSLETLDVCLGRLYQAVEEQKGILIVTADHGNCETMLDDENRIVTSHTTSKVPFIITDPHFILKDGKLGDIAPTILNLLDIEIPDEMVGETLLCRKM